MISLNAILLGLALGTATLAPQAAHPDEAKMSEILPASGQAQVGKLAPWLAGWTLGDQVFNLNRPFRDESVQRLALVFWATWCVPCRDGIKRLEAATEQLASAGTSVALVNVGEQSAQVLRFVAEQFQGGVSPFTVVLDPHMNSVGPYFGQALTLPLTVVVDREGKVRRIIRAKGDDYVELLLGDEEEAP